MSSMDEKIKRQEELKNRIKAQMARLQPRIQSGTKPSLPPPPPPSSHHQQATTASSTTHHAHTPMSMTPGPPTQQQRSSTDDMVDDAVQRVLLMKQQRQQQQQQQMMMMRQQRQEQQQQQTPAVPVGSSSKVGGRLVLDSSGNLVDVETGSVVRVPTRPQSTTMANIKYQREQRSRKLLLKKPPDIRRSLGYDPRMRVPSAARGKRPLQLDSAGKFIEQAKRSRQQQEEQEAAEKRAEEEREHMRKRRVEEERLREWRCGERLDLTGETHMRMVGAMVEEEAMAVVQQEQEHRQRNAVPDVEWWDARILLGSSQGYATDAATGRIAVRERLVGNVLVEHPVPESPVERAREVGPMPLMLTKAERRKLRTQTRVQREREKQQKVRLGIIPPPPPKANLGNFMRVHLNDGTIDPTHLEKTIRGQIQQRIQNHLDRNEERALTKEERYEKKLRKLREDEQKELVCAVFRVSDLQHPQNRHIIYANTKDLHITGVAIMSDRMNMIVAEGGPRSIRKFVHVLCDRIDWNLAIDLTKVHHASSGSADPMAVDGGSDAAGKVASLENGQSSAAKEQDEENNNDEQDDLLAALGGTGTNSLHPVSMIREREGNFCQLVWRGTQTQRNFQEFKFHQFGKNPARAIRRFLRRHDISQYYDTCLPERNPVLLGQ